MKINKNLLIIIFVFFAGYFFINYNSENKAVINKNVKVKYIKITKPYEKPYVGNISKSIFVPYWSLNLEKFSSLNFINSKKYLTLRMTNTDDNLKILKDEKIIKKIIAESIEIAQQYDFSGIVLDLELGVLFGDEIIDQINNFSNSFYEEIIKNNLKYSIAIYGDVFYRKRPYDVSSLAKNSDEIMIMAYDFHKSIGEPGPNFPSEYFDEFINKIPSNKLTIIFGMYGYDWIVDDKDRPIKPAQSLTLNQIKSKYSNYCNEERCEFVDENKRRHIIWYENEESVSKKIKYLKTRGVGSFAYWAAGYF